MDRWQTYIEQGRDHQQRGHYPQAEKLYEAARRLADATGEADLAHFATAALGHCLAEQNRANEAAQRLQQVVVYFARRLNTPSVTAPAAVRMAGELWRIGAYYNDLGRFDAAEQALRVALAAFQARLPPDSPEIARCLTEMARVAEGRGQLEAAEDAYRKAVAILRRTAARDTSMAWALHGLGHVCFVQYRLDEAEQVLLEAYTLLQQEVGNDSPDLGWILATVAEVYEAQGRVDQAVAFYRRAIGLELKAERPDEVAVATRIGQLAGLHWDQGELDEAQRLLDQAIERMSRAAGPQHPSTGALWRQLADVLWDQGDLERALKAASTAQLILEPALGPQDPEVATILNIVASLLYELGRYDEAEPKARQSAEIFGQVMPGEHFNATAMNLLGQIARARGKLEEAEQLLMDSIALMVRAVGESDPRVITSVNNLAAVYVEADKPDKAEGVLRWVLNVTTPALGFSHPQVALALDTLVTVLREMGRGHEADELLRWATESAQ